MNDQLRKLFEKAIAGNAWKQLLLGADGYACTPKWSPTPGSTDLAVVLPALAEFIQDHGTTQVRLTILSAVEDLVTEYEGLVPVATCVLIETLRAKRGCTTIGLPVKQIATRLNASIERHRCRLINDNSGFGREWPDGILGELRRLSDNTVRLGGPGFCT